MARFYVGQRVKKVRGELGVGLTGSVSSEPISPFNAISGADITVCVDQVSPSADGRLITPGEAVATKASEWEPILPSGHQPAQRTVRDPHHGGSCEWMWDGARLWHRHDGQSKWVEAKRIHPTPARIAVLHSLMQGEGSP